MKLTDTSANAFQNKIQSIRTTNTKLTLQIGHWSQSIRLTATLTTYQTASHIAT